MKKYFFYIPILSFLLICFSCQDEDILLSKPGEAIDPVTNLDYSIAGDKVNLTWKLPSTLPNDIIEPVSVQIKISIDGQNKGARILENAPESFTFSSYDPSKKYRFTVKLKANVDTTDPHVSDLRYSLGNTIGL